MKTPKKENTLRCRFFCLRLWFSGKANFASRHPMHARTLWNFLPPQKKARRVIWFKSRDDCENDGTTEVSALSQNLVNFNGPKNLFSPCRAELFCECSWHWKSWWNCMRPRQFFGSCTERKNAIAHECRSFGKRSCQEKEKLRKSFSVFVRNSSKLCNRNRNQKYVKFEESHRSKIWLKKREKINTRERKVFSSKKIKTKKKVLFLFKTFKAFVFLSLEFVLCKTVSWRDEPVLINTAIAGMFEHNSSVQHEEQKKLTF